MKETKAYLNVLKLRLNMRLKREVVSNYPVAAFIEPNLFCNLQCPACPTGLRLDLRPRVSIREELFKAAIDEIGDYVFQLYMYNWGEPLLHKTTPELIRYAKAKEIKIILSTNLSMNLTDDYIERLVRSGLDTLIVSLDGVTEEVYKKYRRNGDLNLVRENVRRIRDMKERLSSPTPTIVWQFLVFRHNEHEIGEAQRQYKEWGADELSIGTAIMPLEPGHEGFEPSTLPQYNMYHPDNFVQREAQRQISSGRSCSWLYGVFVLNPNGKVSPCCAVPAQRDDFGDYAPDKKFFDVWNNETFRRARGLFGKRSKSSEQKNGNGTPKSEKAHLVDGMGVSATLALTEDELICQKCPIPFLQDYIDPIIVGVTNRMADSFMQDSFSEKVQHLFHYLLMGLPNWPAIRRRGASRLKSYFRSAFVKSVLRHSCALSQTEGFGNLSVLNQATVTEERDGLLIHATGPDAQLGFRVTAAGRCGVSLDISSPAATLLELFYEVQHQPFSAERVVQTPLKTGRNQVMLLINHPQFSGGIRLDPGAIPGDFSLHSLQIFSNAPVSFVRPARLQAELAKHGQARASSN